MGRGYPIGRPAGYRGALTGAPVRPSRLALALAAGCALPDDAPACLLDELHTCPTIEVLQQCNNLLALDGLTVTFVGGAPTAYDAVVSFDGEATTFHCDDTDGATVTAGLVWSCGATGFQVSGHGDVVEIEVTADGVTSTAQVEPCWNATEFNGRCCGWTYTADAELELG